MAVEIYLGEPPAGIKAWILAHFVPAGHPETRVKYVGGSMAAFDIVGELTNESIGNVSNVEEVDVGNTVTSIGDYVFRDCTSLMSVTIPDSITSIMSSAFYNCSGLTSVHIIDLTKWCSISFGDINANPLYYAHDLYLNGEKVTALTIPEGVTSIEDLAFADCSLTSVIIGNSVMSIGGRAFIRCSGLTSVTIGNSVTSIGERAFFRCSGLTSVTIGIGVTSIGNYAFYYCSGLTSVTFQGKTLAQVQAMDNYPWGIEDTSIINVA